MILDEHEIIKLIEEGHESEFLDFKRDQYTKPQFDSFIKDIMAMVMSLTKAAIYPRPGGLGDLVAAGVSASATLSFIISFGFSKAIMNLYAGHMAERLGRKKVLILGWFIGIFVPVIILHADSWFWIIIANILLGINQGLTWSMTVNMKVDLVHSRQRGLAVGLNEFAGYIGLSVIAFLSGYACHFSWHLPILEG